MNRDSIPQNGLTRKDLLLKVTQSLNTPLEALWTSALRYWDAVEGVCYAD